MVADDPHLPPRYVVEQFTRAYDSAYNCKPSIRYMGNHWYSVNGETVHRVTIMQEIAHLRDLSSRRQLINTEKSLIHRIIDRLKRL
jgi:hypothetical protein